MDNLGLLLWSYYKYKHLYRFKSRKQLEQWQNRKIRSFMERIVPKSRYYSKLYAGLDIGNWQEFPMINKQSMMDNFSDLNTYGIEKEEAMKVAFEAEKSRDFSPQIRDVTVGLSSGTSGNRGLFLASPSERATWAGAILAKALPDGIFVKERIAFFLRANSNLYEAVDSSRISFKFFDLLKPIDEQVDELNKYQPSILVAPPSMLRILAERVEDKSLIISCKKVISVAEVLEKIDNEFIRETFNQTVHQVYQATEGFLATTCRNGTLHLNEDIVCVQKEYIDKASGRFIPIITDFSRTTQPILRYRLNDILIEKREKCSCGSCFTAIEAIEGRTDDIFYAKAKDSDKMVGIFPDFIRREVIMTSPQISEYKVNQVSTVQLEVYLKLEDGVDTDIIKSMLSKNLKKLFDDYNCCVPQIKFIDRYEPVKGNKLRRIERKFDIGP
ncbi:putative adenylate-forming enzyme [Anaerosolibacter carboniphilus]|uniref:Putative adenylate-forming enzyme n=1 Tax=Anaerosolibacter carboniphilus TaxID=1417629 RepID=A0A841KVW0_9FIRM|nr:F390 synthetase-related protein [Anaerosolibacter carboniphilus]MBB6214315.1 putative adenylate-forming enzyme [Anaerosolibacter carboniphilus]